MSAKKYKMVRLTVYVPEEVAREATNTADRLNIRRGHLYGVAFSLGYNRLAAVVPGAVVVPVASAKSEDVR